MCRLLAIQRQTPFAAAPYLKRFAAIARTSQEYQGHGWGFACLQRGEWFLYKSLRPIWEDDLEIFGDTTLLLAHARSAFRNEGIAVANNMPFFDGERMFMFNGELQGVRIRAMGRIGAEKIFNTIRRMQWQHQCELRIAMADAGAFIERRTAYIKAMNIVLADKQQIYLYSHYNEIPDYFTLYTKKDTGRVQICSRPFAGEDGWQPLPNKSLGVYTC
jgi:glutamine amidotransferase